MQNTKFTESHVKISEYAGIDQYMIAPAFEGKTGSRDFFDYIGWYTNHTTI